MINVQENFKIDLRTYGRQFNIKLKVNNSDFNADNLNYIKPSFTTPLFKTIMHQIELDSKVFMYKGTKISGRIGVKVNEKNYKYIDLNNYYVQSCERQEDTNSYRVLAYSKMKKAMLDYDLSFEGKTTVRNYLIKICERLGWNTDNIPATFINSEKLVDPSLHTGINYSFRDALDEIATITCSFLMFKGDNFYLLYLTETNETIDESYLDEDNVTIGEKYFINSLVFSRAEESDNIYRKDNTSITANGLHEYRIADCQLLSTNDRADYIDEMFNYLKTLEFYIFDVQSKGILFLEACDLFNFKLNNITYKVALLNDEINIDDGLAENLFLDEPEETKTEYKYADSTDKKINQAYILVDKQNKKIIQKVSSVEQSVENITNTQNTATGKNIHLEDSSDDPLVSIKVEGSTTQSTRSGKNIFNKKAKIIENGATKSVLDTGVRITQTHAGQYRYDGIRLGGSELLGKTLRISANWTKSADNVPYIAVYLGNSSSMALYSLFGTGVSGQIRQITIPNAFPAVGEQVCDTVYILLYSNRDGTGNVGDYVNYTDLIVTVDNDDMTYEDYGVSPSPDYTSPIENVEGKNKFDINQEKEIFGIMLYKYSYYLKPNTKYTISSNCPASTTANIYANSNSSNSAVYINKNQTIQSDENGYFYILVRFKADASDNSTFNLYKKVLNGTYYIQLEEGTVATPYVPYNSLEIKDTGENLFDCANSKIIYNNGNTSYERLDNGLKLISSGVQYNMIYFLVDTVENLKGKTLTLSSDILFSKEKQYVNFGLYYTDFNSGNRKSFGLIESIKTEGYYTIKGIVEEGENRDYVCIGLRPNMDSNFAKGDYTIYDNLQVEIGETATPYKPYQEQKVTFPLENQKLMEDSYLASDGIHHKRKQYVITGNETIEKIWIDDDTHHVFAIKASLPVPQISDKTYKEYLCNTYRVLNYDGGIDSIWANRKDNNTNYTTAMAIDYANSSLSLRGRIIIKDMSIDDIDKMKTYLSEQYSNGTPVIVEYEPSEEEIVPYTEAQQEAWDKIEQLHTYKNVTNIFSDAELDIVYVRDNGLSDMYETKQNANKKYTKTSTEIQQLDDSIKRTISQIGDRSQKTTTITEDIDGINSKVKNFQDLTQTTSGTKTIVLSNCAKGDLLSLRIKGNNTVFEYLYPSSNLYPANNLLPMGDSRISVNETVYELGITDVLRKNGEVYDEFVLENGQAKIIHRINTDGTVKAKETTEDLGKLSILLNEGKNTIKIINYSAEITAKYVIKSDYTKAFATKVEMNSSIEQTAEKIESNVSKTYQTLEDAKTQYSNIKQTTDEITTEVGKKVGENEIISKINQSAEAVGISANKIELSAIDVLNLLAGNSINLTSKNIIISSEYLNIDKKGNMIFKVLGTEVFQVQNSKDSSKRVYITDQGVVIDHSSGIDRIDMIVTGDGEGMLTCSGKGTTTVKASGITTPTLTQTSKAESKKNFEKFTLEEAKEILNNTDIYKYNLKTQDDKDKKHIGFVIGDDYNYSEKITSEKNDGANIYSMTSVLYTVVKEQQKQIEELQQRVEKLEGGQDK